MNRNRGRQNDLAGDANPKHLTRGNNLNDENTGQINRSVQGLCNGTVSVRLSNHSTAAGGGIAAVGPSARKYRSVVTQPAFNRNGAAARRSAANTGSAMLTAKLTTLNTDLFSIVYCIYDVCKVCVFVHVIQFTPQQLVFIATVGAIYSNTTLGTGCAPLLQCLSRLSLALSARR